MNTNTTPRLTITEGKTLNYLAHAVFCGIGAIIGFALFWPIGILLAVACILLFLVETGLEFDPATLQYRKFKQLSGSRWGNWVPVTQPESFHLRLSVESETYQRYPLGTSPSYYGSRGASSKSLTYDIQVLNESGEWITIYEFLSYKLALRFLREIGNLERWEVTDHVALKLQENQQKRAARRR